MTQPSIVRGCFLALVFLTSLGSGDLRCQTSYDLLFLHHSVGYSWLVNGGLYLGLRTPANVGGRNIAVHYATYGDEIGNNTDTNHWRRKFRDRMNKVLTFDLHPNKYYATKGRYNRVVMFKSCFPNSVLEGVGALPGNPDSPTRSLTNYMAVFEELGLIFDDHPDVLFIYVTSPPRNAQDHWTLAGANLHRYFVRWLQYTWLPEYKRSTGSDNVAVFDLFDILAEPESHATAPNALKAIYAKGSDSHPQPNGLNEATRQYLPFLGQALTAWEKSRYLGCGPTAATTPWLHEGGRARLNNMQYTLKVERIAPAGSGVILGGVALQPQPLGAGGCSLMTLPYLTLPVIGHPTLEEATVSLPIPARPALIGTDIYLQAVISDSKGAFLNLVNLSNPLRVRILAR